MYSGFLQCYRHFHEQGLEDPLGETLRLFDVLSNGAIRKTNLEHLDGSGIKFKISLASAKQASRNRLIPSTSGSAPLIRGPKALGDT